MATLEILAALGRAVPSIMETASDLFDLVKRSISGETVTAEEFRAAEALTGPKVQLILDDVK